MTGSPSTPGTPYRHHHHAAKSSPPALAAVEGTGVYESTGPLPRLLDELNVLEWTAARRRFRRKDLLRWGVVGLPVLLATVPAWLLATGVNDLEAMVATVFAASAVLMALVSGLQYARIRWRLRQLVLERVTLARSLLQALEIDPIRDVLLRLSLSPTEDESKRTSRPGWSYLDAWLRLSGDLLDGSRVDFTRTELLHVDVKEFTRATASGGRVGYERVKIVERRWGFEDVLDLEPSPSGAARLDALGASVQLQPPRSAAASDLRRSGSVLKAVVSYGFNWITGPESSSGYDPLHQTVEVFEALAQPITRERPLIAPARVDRPPWSRPIARIGMAAPIFLLLAGLATVGLLGMGGFYLDRAAYASSRLTDLNRSLARLMTCPPAVHGQGARPDCPTGLGDIDHVRFDRDYYQRRLSTDQVRAALFLVSGGLGTLCLPILVLVLVRRRR